MVKYKKILPGDGLWPTDTEIEKSFIVTKCNSRPGSGTSDQNFIDISIKRFVDDDCEQLLVLYNKITDQQNKQKSMLDRIHQLALQDYWLNPEDPKKVQTTHTRLNHSLGVMRVAETWVKYLQKCMLTISELKNDDELKDRFKDWRKRLVITALMHDIGHIPFSHLIERVFGELHWSFNDMPYHHETLTRIRLLSLIKETMKEDVSGSAEEQEKNRNRAFEEFMEYERLLDGVSGITWLDCIMNSPFDADKIDYIFRDQQWMGLTGRQGDTMQWLKDFLSGQEITTEGGQIFLHGKSAVAAYRFLSERSYLYNTLYFSPRMRLMERIVQYILCSYFILRFSNEAVESFFSLSSADNGKDDNHEKFAELFRKGVVEQTVTNVLNEERKLESPYLDQFLNDLTYYMEYRDFSHRYCNNEEKKEAKKDCKAKKGKLAEEENGQVSLDQKASTASRIYRYFTDFGTLKLACAIAETYRMIDQEFPWACAFRENLNNGDKDSVIKGAHKRLIPFVSRSKSEDLQLEVKILLEIGIWAADQHSRSGKQKSIYEQILNLCCLVIDKSFITSWSHDGIYDHDRKSSNPPHYSESYYNSGQWLDRIFTMLCFGGPYILRAPSHIKKVHEAESWLNEKKREIFEIGRQIEAEHPGRLLVDVIGPFHVCGYPEKRVIKVGKRPIVNEMFYVPEGDPASWSVKTPASIPLHQVDFRTNIPVAYKLRIILIDPMSNTVGREYLKDRFQKVCFDKGIHLKEV